jgi:hypothetical protein
MDENTRVTHAIAPTMISSRITSGRARIKATSKCTVVSHRELIEATVLGSTTYTNQKILSLNPGLSATFPWLSVQAIQFQEYRFRKVEFEWIPFAPTTTQGDVTLAVDYDASNATPTTEVQASNLAGTVVDSCWKPITLRLKPEHMHAVGPKKYVRRGNAYGDVKTFDSGTFYLATENETSTASIGKLYVSYTVELYTPINSGQAGLTNSVAHSWFGLELAPQTIGTGTTTTVGWDTSATSANPLNIVNNAGTLTPPPGFYRFETVINMADTNNEALSLQVLFHKNGVFPTTYVTAPSVISAAVAANKIQVHAVAFLSMNGTDTLTVKAAPVGAAGTLTIPVNTSYLMITPA